jgi:DNA-binding response OmpR family regulator
MATILLVESYPPLASLYHQILSEEGHEVFVASSQKEATDIALKRQIELVLVDEGLRDGSEEALIEKLKSLQPSIKGILCSMTEFSRETYRDLCDEGIIKTSDYTILQRKVTEVLSKIGGHDPKAFEPLCCPGSEER